MNRPLSPQNIQWEDPHESYLEYPSDICLKQGCDETPMTSQLELNLKWNILRVDQCRHPSLRHDGVMFEGEPDEISLVTCYHPHHVHCGGTFDARRFNRSGVVLYEGKLYSLDRLRNWYAPRA